MVWGYYATEYSRQPAKNICCPIDLWPQKSKSEASKVQKRARPQKSKGEASKVPSQPKSPKLHDSGFPFHFDIEGNSGKGKV